jgi:Flp pilus assembly protein TadD
MVADLALYRGQPARAVAADPLQPRYRASAGGLQGLRAAARLNDPEPGAYTALGDAEAAAGHLQEARDAYWRALELYPFFPDARKKLGLPTLPGSAYSSSSS